jgi:hypothetical protein
MDYSQYLRLKQEAANIYLARNKTVDSSLLTMKKQQLASYSGSTRLTMPPYYMGKLVVNPILYDISSCPIDHAYTGGYTSVLKLSQHGTLVSEKAGAAICGDADYSKVSPGIVLLNPSTCSTILTSYDNNTSAPGQWKSYGRGLDHFFPVANCSTINKYPYPSG